MTAALLLQVCLAWFAMLTPVYLVAAFKRAIVMVWSANVGMVVGLMLLGATVYRRGVEVGHAPFQTLYEVYLVLALSLVAAYLLIHVSGGLEILKKAGTVLLSLFGAVTCVSTAIVLALGMTAGDFQTDLPPALQSPWFVPHVVVYLFGYGSLGLAVGSSALFLAGSYTGRLTDETLKLTDAFTHRIIAMGFPFLTAGLIFGSLWAYEAWANWWAWDSKEVWSLISWFTYLIYMHLRRIKGWKGRPAAWVVIAGGACIAVTLLLFGYLPASLTSVHKY